MTSESRRRLSLAEHVDGVRSGDRVALGRAITLAESSRPEDRTLARELLGSLLPETGASWRVGVTGPPGAGKSTLVEALGTLLCDRGKRVAVLAVDPSSSRTGGSVLADRTRMPRLSAHPLAFVRPSPSGSAEGGVSHRTREAILLCEAAGYEIVLLETVGVGQAEARVAEMVDHVLLVLHPGAGDELQATKRGLVELCDTVAVNKGDGSTLKAALAVRDEYAAALALTEPRTPEWTPRAVACSAQAGHGVPEIWGLVEEHRRALSRTGAWETRRVEQRLAWLWRSVERELEAGFRGHPRVAADLPALEEQVARGTLLPEEAAVRLMTAFAG